MELTAETRQFMEQVAGLLEAMGVNRSSGRMFGLLLLADRPMSLDELVETLGMSKPSVSANTRLYEQLQLLQRVHVPGDRKHYYEILPGAFERTAAARAEALRGFAELTDAGLKIIDDDNDIARARLDEMGSFYRHLVAAMNRALAEWQERRAAPNLPIA